MDGASRPVLGEGEEIEPSGDLQLVLYDTHCATAGCGNGDFTIRVPAAAENPLITCGGCDSAIIDCTLIE